MEEAGDGVARGVRVQNAQIDMPRRPQVPWGTAQPKAHRPERTEEGRAELEGGRAALDCETSDRVGIGEEQGAAPPRRLLGLRALDLERERGGQEVEGEAEVVPGATSTAVSSRRARRELHSGSRRTVGQGAGLERDLMGAATPSSDPKLLAAEVAFSISQKLGFCFLEVVSFHFPLLHFPLFSLPLENFILVHPATIC